MMAMASMRACVELGPCFFHHSRKPSVSLATRSRPSGGIRITPVGGGDVVVSTVVPAPTLRSVMGSPVSLVMMCYGSMVTVPSSWMVYGTGGV